MLEPMHISSDDLSDSEEDQSADTELERTKNFLHARLMNDKVKLYDYDKEFRQIKDLLLRTAEFGESNSALLIGRKKCGKNTLVSSVIYQLQQEAKFSANSLIVYLNGIHNTDDRIALKSATTQLKLENAVNGKVFGSFAENLAFLLACLKAGDKNASKSVIFIIDEFEMFCAHHNQTLLYNLFDIAQSAQAPICVLGLTCRFDVVELLEKRVKSRFSHRQIFLMPVDCSFNSRVDIFRELLSLPLEREIQDQEDRGPFLKENKLIFLHRLFDLKKYKNTFGKKRVKLWNDHVNQLLENNKVLDSLQAVYDYDLSIYLIKEIIYRMIPELSENEPFPQASLVQRVAAHYSRDDNRLRHFCDLSVLELCLLISIKHHNEIYDREPFNYLMIWKRLKKFMNSTRIKMDIFHDRRILKSFEHLQNWEVIVPINSSKNRIIYQMHKVLLTNGQITKIVSKYPNCPTDIAQWAQSSLI